MTGAVRFHASKWASIMPREPGEKAHLYLGRMPRRKKRSAESECEACERVFARAQGYAGASHFAFVIREIATALVKVGRGAAYREISRDLRDAHHRRSTRGEHPGFPAGSGQLASDYTDVFAPLVLGTHRASDVAADRGD
jgi:hypothetical protein